MINIAKAVTNDVQAIQGLLKETWVDTYGNYLSQETLDEVYKNWQSIEFLTRQVENPEMYFPVAKENDEVVGIATARFTEETIVLFRIYVDPGHQRKGIGEALINDVINYYSGAKKIQLHVEVMNGKGQAFYKKHGFKEIKREEEKVVNETIEQILMEKEL